MLKKYRIDKIFLPCSVHELSSEYYSQFSKILSIIMLHVIFKCSLILSFYDFASDFLSLIEILLLSDALLVNKFDSDFLMKSRT
jgi:hypothetical protein